MANFSFDDAGVGFRPILEIYGAKVWRIPREYGAKGVEILTPSGEWKFIDMQTIHAYENPNKPKVQYDYTNQAWVVDGIYQNCGHPEDMYCGCFGRSNVDTSARNGAKIY